MASSPHDGAGGSDAPNAGHGRSTGPWSELTLRVPSELGEDVLGWFASESLGAWSRPDEADGERLRVFFDSKKQALAAARLARSRIGRMGLDLGDCDVAVRDVADEHWLERYQASLSPFPLAGRFVVCPTGEVPSAGWRTPIRLVPGRAFGTGEHPTTQLSAGLLERRVRPGETWLDLGCGSGILSLVALGCGAARVLAVDIDAESVLVAREVLEANRALDRVELRTGCAAELPPGWDGVVVNILASFFLEHAAELARLVSKGGTVIASGFLADELPEVETALARFGLDSIERAEQGRWRACVFRLSTDGSS